jgi:hypothetical protein
MASRINVVVALTPINEIPAVANEYPAHEMVDAQVGGSVAHAFTVGLDPEGNLPNPTGMVRVGSLSGYVYSTSARYAGVSSAPLAFSGFGEGRVLFVRHTGKLFGTTASPGNIGVNEFCFLNVRINGNLACVLEPGQAVAVPLNNILVEDASLIKLAMSGAGYVAGTSVAVEALILG